MKVNRIRNLIEAALCHGALSTLGCTVGLSSGLKWILPQHRKGTVYVCTPLTWTKDTLLLQGYNW